MFLLREVLQKEHEYLMYEIYKNKNMYIMSSHDVPVDLLH